MNRFKLAAALCAALLTFSAGAALADRVSVNMKEINFALGMERNMNGYIRLSGVLTDLLRAQKTEFGKIHKSEVNTAAQKAEELLNEAGLPASQGDYDGSFELLSQAAKVILEAINKLNSE